MKTISITAKYQVVVPDDMSAIDILDLAKDKIKEQFDSFTICVEKYPNEEYRYRLFGLKSVAVMSVKD